MRAWTPPLGNIPPPLTLTYPKQGFPGARIRGERYRPNFGANRDVRRGGRHTPAPWGLLDPGHPALLGDLTLILTLDPGHPALLGDQEAIWGKLASEPAAYLAHQEHRDND